METLHKATPPVRLDSGNVRELSNTELLSEIAHRAKFLVREEIDLAKFEIRDNIKSEITMAKGLGVATVCGLVGLSLLFVTVALALGAVMPAWLASLLVGVVVLIAGAIVGMVGWNKRVRRPLANTRETLKEDVQWAKDRLH